MKDETALTKFEKDLQAFFPDIFKLHIYGKADKFLWDAIYALMEYREKDESGEIVIRYNCGKIDKIYRGVNLTSESHKPFLGRTGTEEV